MEENEVIILGAFGCRAFENNPEVVAQAAKEVIENYLYSFKVIEYAVYCSPRDEANYRIFERTMRKLQRCQEEKMMNIKRYDIYSGKYDIQGEIQDGIFSCDLVFEHAGKNVRIALDRPYPFQGEEGIKKLGLDTMEVYIEKLQNGEIKERKTMLHYWYVTEVEKEGEKYVMAKGVVTGHPGFTDSQRIYTSEVKSIEIDDEAEEAIIFTKNTVYYCPLEYCRFGQQDKETQLIPNYEEFRAKYMDKMQYPSAEPGNVLLVLANFSEYYFHSLYYVPEGATEPLDYTGHAHVGTYQDSYLVGTDDYSIDLRYFPHYQNIEFYSMDTNDRPLYLENIGDMPLYAKSYKGVIHLAPGDRKLVARENAEKEVPNLPSGDLYPAQWIE